MNVPIFLCNRTHMICCAICYGPYDMDTYPMLHNNLETKNETSKSQWKTIWNDIILGERVNLYGKIRKKLPTGFR